MNKFMKIKHRGFGGLYFLTSTFLAAVILFFTFRLSWASNVASISNNLAYIASINTSVKNYVNKVDPYTSQVNPTVVNKSDGVAYSTLKDMQDMLKESKIASEVPNNVTVTWTGKQTVVKFGSFKDILGQEITPETQQSVIEIK